MSGDRLVLASRLMSLVSRELLEINFRSIQLGSGRSLTSLLSDIHELGLIRTADNT